ncbi:GNAT family N-acetyltransferase [Kitasatospora sp. RG8]|uniref:GNAT family N-acetyltransferase n=1 Tax=Kitasatospora sp. RG8 TaxID=2820815 RepID=UPI001ADF567A|nr:GNAT family N-acetyltransferase [Kitasatospora sp. RG8]MBP0448369.1 GNAT family N-acetyltransferase [Kitasatospora sp. RG8]
MTYRPFQPSTDYPPLAGLLSATGARPVTAEELRAQDARLPPSGSLFSTSGGLLTGYGRIRLVTPGADGELLAFATAWRAPWTPPGDVASLIVGSAGLATARLLPLADALEQWARGAGARRLLGELPDDRADLLRLLVARGHRIDAHVRSASARLGALPPAAPPPGIRFGTLAATSAPRPALQLYQLYRETLDDNPGFVDALPDFDRWYAEVVAGDGCRPDWVFTAEFAGRIVGVNAVRATDDQLTCHIDYTGVVRPWRSRGLARALKLHAAHRLAAHGVRTARTEVEAGNLPMIAVNTALGYRWETGHHRLVKDLPGS